MFPFGISGASATSFDRCRTIWARAGRSERLRLDIAANLVEATVTLALVIAHVRRTEYRRFTAVILGALTPTVIALAPINYYSLFGDKRGWFSQMFPCWQPIVGALVACLLFGAGVALSPIPRNLVARYFFGVCLVGAIVRVMVNAK
jgi:hypothetical protein